MRKILRTLGIALLCIPFPIILGSVGSADLEVITLTQAMLQCFIALALGVVGFVLMYITEHTPKTKTTPTPNVNPYSKCCYCPHYVDCCKSYTELLQCEGGQLSNEKICN